MLRKLTWATLPIGLTALAAFGCGDSQTKTPHAGTTGPSPEARTKDPSKTEGHGPSKSGEHGHKPGGHGGIIVSFGSDSYHAEAVFEKGGVVRIYTLGKDEARILEVESQTLTGYVKLKGETESVSMLFKAEPQPGDAEGKTSQFVGRLPNDLTGQEVEVTIPSIRIAAERFRIGFSNASATHGEEGMPTKVAAEDEKKLYLTPGGIYTEADIQANGNKTVSEKFKGFQSAHDMNPKPGDKICPVTMTKANPKCSWIVAGKTYEFCCPPCVDEFVKTAKEQPDQIKEPGDYIKK